MMFLQKDTVLRCGSHNIQMQTCSVHRVSDHLSLSKYLGNVLSRALAANHGDGHFMVTINCSRHHQTEWSSTLLEL